MPSQEHEALVDLFRASPAMVVRLLREVGIDLGRELQASLVESSFASLAADYHADCAVELRDAAGAARLVALVEVQRARDPAKRASWPLYEAAARARHGVDACVVVVAPDEGVARWASQPVVLGPSGSTFVPVVLGPGAIPAVRDPAEAARAPELAVLSAVAHGNDPGGVQVAFAAVCAASRLPEERTRLYFDVILAALNGAARAALEELMDPSKYEYKSDFARKYVAQGRAEGEAEGMAKGKVAGKAEGRVEALLQLVAARGLTLSGPQRDAVLACRDLARLERWFARAVTASSVEDILASE